MRARIAVLALGFLLLLPAAPAPAAEVVKDGSFDGTPVGEENPNWEEGGFVRVICDVETCGDGGGTAGPRSGSNWAFFGGIPSPDFEFVAQVVTIPSGPASLSFWLRHGRSNGGAADLFRVFLGDQEVFRLSEGAAGYQTYRQVTIDVGRLAGGGGKELSFEYQTFGGVPEPNFSLDDISIQAGAAGGTLVTLRGPKSVPEGKKAKLKAAVQPCPAHAGDVIELRRGKKKIASQPSSSSCGATFKVKITRTSTFQAAVGGVLSKKLKIRAR